MYNLILISIDGSMRSPRCVTTHPNVKKNKKITTNNIHKIVGIFISKQNQIKIKNLQIIERLIDIVIYLAKGDKPFRDHDKSKIGIERELFLDFVGLLSKYDPNLKDHLINGL